MKGVTVHRHGGVEELRYENIEVGSPGKDEVRIRTLVAGVNPADHKHRAGMFRAFLAYRFPYVGGYDVAGIVEAVGEGVDHFRVGDRVFALLDPMLAGGYAQAVVTKARHCALVPEDLDLDRAAALPCAGLTGIQIAERVVSQAPGPRILITGATGMVGRFALWKVKALGAYAVAAVRPDYKDEALAAGADEAVLFGNPLPVIPFDGVIDTVGGEAATALATAARPGAPIATAATDPMNPARLFSTPELVAVKPDGTALRALGEAVARGEIKVPISARYPLEKAAEAQARMEAGGARGKILLDCG